MLIALYERVTGLYASLVNINAYHQPGVEAGKKAAERVIDIQGKLLPALAAAGRPLTAGEAAEAAGDPDAAETAYHILRHLSANPGRKIARQPGATAGQDLFSAG